MRTQIVFLLIALACFGGSLHAQWISFEKGISLKQEPEVKLISSNESEVIIEIALSGVMIEQVATKDGNCHVAGFLNDIVLNDPEKPALPYIAKTLAIPDEASVSFEIMETGDVETIDNIKLVAGRESWIEGDPMPEYSFPNYTQKGYDNFPEDMVSISEPSIFRDFRICRVSIFPAKYNSTTEQLNLVKKLKVKIKFSNGLAVNKKTIPKRNIAPSFAAIYKHTIFNYEEVVGQFYKGREEAPEVLLVITPDDYYEHIQNYVKWKRQAGYEVILTKFEDISANSTNPTIIRDYIADLYATLENPPTYAILVGDASVFPYKMVVYSDYSFPDEGYFGKVEGDDFIPDIFIGRIPALSPGELNVITNKLIQYEKNPYMENTSWFKQGLCCSNNLYESQVTTKEFTADIMLIDGGFSLVNEYMSDDFCTYTTNDAIYAINEGRSFVNYRGEGWSTGWAANCTPFELWQLDYLTNGRMHSFVTSIGCGVAMFTFHEGDCFGEKWLKLGSISNPNGAINFVGPVSNTHTAENNSLDRGIYIGMFQEGLTTPGQALMRGKMNVYNDFGAGAYETQYQFNVYTDLGDPSTKIWKDVPYEITVAHSDSITVDTTTITIVVDSLESGAPVSNAVVTVSGNDIVLSAKTDAQGKVIFDNEFTSDETLIVTVTGDNIKTYSGTIQYSNSNGIGDIMSIDQSMISISPNPITNHNVINYNITESAYVNLFVYDISGRVVRNLFQGQKGIGSYQIDWNGCDNRGVELDEGVYFISLQSKIENHTIRIVKL
jgi:hypothetical protein